MITSHLLLHSFIFSFISSISALNLDGTTLLSFKHSLLPPSPWNHPPLLQNWNQSDPNPCSWAGVTCAPQTGAVTGLSLPNSHLSGPIPDELANLQYLQFLDLSNNSINGTLPVSIFNCSELRTLSLSSNFISGDLPEEITSLQFLQVVNLSNNEFSGGIPGRGFDSVEVFDLSSNSFTGVLPLQFGGGSLKYFNLSNNKISGSVNPTFVQKFPANAVVDFSFNNLTGEIPKVLSDQKTVHFAGNLDLCGKPLDKICTVPSSHSSPPNVSLSDGSDSAAGSATAAIAAIPRTAGEPVSSSRRKVNSWKITAIVVGTVGATMILVVVSFHAYQFRKMKTNQNPKETAFDKSEESRAGSCFCGGTEEESSETATVSEFVSNKEEEDKCLVMVDGETELETETLLKSSAYILGSSGGGGIVYKAVVGGGGGDGGVEFAVRRIAECGVEKMKEFEKMVRGLSKFRHRNLVRVRGFYWGEEEKLVIYDFVSNGSLAMAGAAYEKALSFEIRLKIAKGIAKGLSYIHEKKHVHGNIKPNNILLTSEMEPVISDFGLEWLISGKTNHATDKSTRNFSSKRSTTSSSRDETMIHHHTYMSPYQAPESAKTLKPNPKWDVYSFGIILLELFTGKQVFADREWNPDSTVADMETKILKIIEESTTFEVHGREDCFLTCLKLGFSCASLVPHKRPSMKEALQVLEKIP
ncbi:hypothetical protein SSX86_024002 [Deinandra increscens subsp. villosa]|uniref:Protein kinase domain-containing protein n=1 Tax=Deinandra increscens subsp. villosa TaxID=3103831 RepID=A0AAP0GRF6_9ASTR